MLRLFASATMVCCLAAGSGGATAPQVADTHPTDAAKSHVEKVTAGPHVYKVVQGGTMDGRNCRLPMGCGLNREGAFIQTWESNRSVRMENVGATDVVNPWLSNGRNDFRSAAEIVAAAVAPGMTDAEKAMALWFQEIRHRHHSGGDNSYPAVRHRRAVAAGGGGPCRRGRIVRCPATPRAWRLAAPATSRWPRGSRRRRASASTRRWGPRAPAGASSTSP